MKIYLWHSTKYDFKEELYKPIKDSNIFKENEIILPHDNEDWINSKEIIKSSDLLIAEISYPSASLGIELGWADAFNVPVFCFCQKIEDVPRSIKAVFKNIVEYNKDNLIESLSKEIVGFKND